MIAAVVLALRMLVVWPDAPVADVVVAAFASVDVGAELDVPAPLLAAIAHHESDLDPRTVSYVVDGRRVDATWPDGVFPAVCGYLSAMAPTRADCAAVIADRGGMAAGAREIAEWLRTCHGDLTCALRGHAGGNRCARGDCTADQLAFVALFLHQAGLLGWSPTRGRS